MEEQKRGKGTVRRSTVTTGARGSGIVVTHVTANIIWRRTACEEVRIEVNLYQFPRAPYSSIPTDSPVSAQGDGSSVRTGKYFRMGVLNHLGCGWTVFAYGRGKCAAFGHWRSCNSAAFSAVGTSH